MRNNWIALFYMIPGNKRHGGGAYAVHLIRSLILQGYRPVVYQITKRTDTTPRQFHEDIPYQRVTVKDACMIARTWRQSLILYAHYKHFKAETDALIAVGAGIVFHAVAELKHEDLLEQCRTRYRRPAVIAIREKLAEGLQAAGVAAEFVPHPYIPNGHRPQGVQRSRHAVNLARVDYAKHTEVIANANTLLEAGKKIEIHGELNRMFAHHTLDPKFPGWRDNWKGGFDLGKGLELAQDSKHVVDLTYWKNDGGGTQYTFLEAWDAGAQLVVHNRWLKTEGTVNRDTAVGVTTAVELVDVLSEPVDARLLDNGAAQLETHAPEKVIPVYAKALGWAGVKA